MSERTPVPHRYSVRATFSLGATNHANYRIRIIPSQLEFQREVGQALRRLDPSASVLSAGVTVFPETVWSRVLRDDAGTWKIQLDATFVSSLRLTRDEWVSVLAIAFLWAYRFEYVNRWDGQSERGVPSDWLGRQGDPSRFVYAANNNDTHSLVVYHGGSMLDLGPIAATVPPAPQAQQAPPQTYPPQQQPAPTQTQTQRPSPPRPQSPAPSEVYMPPPPAGTPSWVYYAGGATLVAAIAAWVVLDD